MRNFPIGLWDIPLIELQGVLEEVRQHVNAKEPNWIVDPSTAALLTQRQQRDFDSMAKLALREGLNTDQFTLLVDSLRQFLTPDVLVQAAFRGIITEERRDQLLDVLGYREEERRIIAETAQFIPPVQDLVRFALRDVFSPAIVEKFQLEQNFPQSFAEQAKKLGMSEEVSRWYWMAHWDLPSVQQGFEMLQRGKIDMVDLNFLLQAGDVMPYWREKLLSIAYNPLTRVDVRRIHKLLGKDRDWLIAQYRNIGYDDANASELADFTIKLNSAERKAELKDITDGLRSRVISGMISGTLSDDDASAALRDIGYESAEIEAAVTEARLFRTDKRVARIAELTGDLYVRGRVDKAAVTTRLREAGFGQAEIDLRFYEWELERDLRAPDPASEKDRDLTRAEIVAAYSDKIMTRDETVSALTDMHYDPKEVGIIIALQDYKDKKAENADAIEVIHAAFIKGTIDETAASNELDKIVSRASQRAALLTKWDKELGAKVADIPLSSVQEMYQRNIADVAWTDNYLAHLGFDAEERTKLMTLWDQRKLEKAQREAAAAAKKVGVAQKGKVGP